MNNRSNPMVFMVKIWDSKCCCLFFAHLQAPNQACVNGIVWGALCPHVVEKRDQSSNGFCLLGVYALYPLGFSNFLSARLCRGCWSTTTCPCLKNKIQYTTILEGPHLSHTPLKHAQNGQGTFNKNRFWRVVTLWRRWLHVKARLNGSAVQPTMEWKETLCTFISFLFLISTGLHQICWQYHSPFPSPLWKWKTVAIEHQHFVQGGALPNYKWVIIPLIIDISPNITYKP